MDRKREDKIDRLYEEYEVINALADLFWPEISGSIDAAIEAVRMPPTRPEMHNKKMLNFLWSKEMDKLIEVENALMDVKKLIEERVEEFKEWAKEKKSDIEALVYDGHELIINGESFLGRAPEQWED